MSRAFVGEWIFSHALFDWDAAHDERYLDEVLLKPPAWLGRAPDAAAGAPARSARCSRRATRRARSSTGAPIASSTAQPRDRRLHERLPAASRLAGAREAASKRGCRTRSIVMGGANCEATMGVETVRQFPFVDAAVSGEADQRLRGAGRARRRAASRSTGCRASITPASVAAAARRSGRAPTAPRGHRSRRAALSRLQRFLRAVRAQPLRRATGSRACSSRRRAAAGGASGCTAPSAA